MQRGIEKKYTERDNQQGERDSEPRNYTQPDPMNVSLEGKSVVVVMVSNRTESGILRVVGQYFLSLELPNKKTLIVSKSGIITVSVL